MIKGFFFDLDGTLVDTHEANYEAYKRALAERGTEITFDDFKKTIGKQSKDFLPLLAPNLKSEEYAAVGEKKAEYYKQLAHLSKLNEALLQFIKYVQPEHVTILVTTARRQNAEVILRHHKLQKYFNFVIAGEDVSRSKPDPEAYILALSQSGLQPSEVITFEDSQSGRQAAEAAGIAVVMVKDFVV